MNLITLASNGYRAVIYPKRGANCISLRNLQYRAKMLREPENPDQLDNPYLYGMPILFPVNRIEKGIFVFDGRNYRFPINEPATGCHLHGFLHETPFEVVFQSEDQVICEYKATEKSPYLTFPHAFVMRIEYELTAQGLRQTTEITNLSAQRMPCLLGFHTTFNLCFADRSDSCDIRAKAEITEEYERAMGSTYLPTGRILPFDDVSKSLASGEWRPADALISRHYLAGETGEMRLTDIKRNLAVVYRNDADFSHRLIYGGGETGFFCMEPQTCLVNAPNAPLLKEKIGVPSIFPGDTKRFSSFISLERI